MRWPSLSSVTAQGPHGRFSRLHQEAPQRQGRARAAEPDGKPQEAASPHEPTPPPRGSGQAVGAAGIGLILASPGGSSGSSNRSSSQQQCASGTLIQAEARECSWRRLHWNGGGERRAKSSNTSKPGQNRASSGKPPRKVFGDHQHSGGRQPLKKRWAVVSSGSGPRADRTAGHRAKQGNVC